ncbi:Conserved_hypothetical protein [Hexamita inflata]|uniref:Uncharacterized protein n=1 Tax=Hexamita inflata TaxID=28002 RepID=A0AA86UYJ0_9EUKA|nr:Conserved hypothetical protein [Hexamita inflata]
MTDIFMSPSQLLQSPKRHPPSFQKRPLSPTDLQISTHFQYWSILDRLIDQNFDNDKIYQFKAFALSLIQTINTQEENEGEEKSINVYSFLRKQRTASIQFRFKCTYQENPALSSLSRYFASEEQIQQIIQIYRLDKLRVDELVLNILYHLKQFLRIFSKKPYQLLVMIRYYHANYTQVLASKHESVLPNSKFKMQQNEDSDSDSAQLFLHNSACIFKSELFLIQMSEIFAQKIRSTAYLVQLTSELNKIFKTPYLNKFVQSRSSIQCDCKIPKTKITRTQHFEELSKLVVNQKETEPETLVRIFCQLKSWLIEVGILQGELVDMCVQWGKINGNCLETVGIEKSATFFANQELRNQQAKVMDQMSQITLQSMPMRDIDDIFQHKNEQMPIDISVKPTNAKINNIQTIDTQDLKLSANVEITDIPPETVVAEPEEGTKKKKKRGKKDSQDPTPILQAIPEEIPQQLDQPDISLINAELQEFPNSPQFNNVEENIEVINPDTEEQIMENLDDPISNMLKMISRNELEAMVIRQQKLIERLTQENNQLKKMK